MLDADDRRRHFLYKFPESIWGSRTCFIMFPRLSVLKKVALSLMESRKSRW